MKKTLSLLLTAIFVIGMSSTSFARNMYASLSGGIAWYDNATLEQAENPNYEDDIFDNDNALEYSFESGLTGTAAVGCDFGSVRLEGELGYQTNDVESVTVFDYDSGEINEDKTASYEGTGSISITSIMFNGYYDIPVTESGAEIFLMAGFGAAQIHWDEVGPGFSGGDYEEDTVNTFSDGSFAWQIGAGVGIPVGDNLMLDARYRYFNTTNITSDDDLEATDNDPMNYDIASHSALVGLRYNF